MRLLILPLALLILLGFEDIPLTDDSLEAEAVAIFGNIGCPVCGGQSLAESSAELANDIRNVIRKRVAQGDNERQILDYLVERYGESVRLAPKVNSSTLILWLLPTAFFISVLLISYYRRR